MSDDDNSEGVEGAVYAAATSGDEVARLVALRDRLARMIDDPKTSARDMSPLMRRFEEVTDRLDDAVAKRQDAAEAAAAGGAVQDEPFDPEDL